jgi:hypothetical protein
MKLPRRGRGISVCWLLVCGLMMPQAMAQAASRGRITIQHQGFEGPQRRSAPLAIEATISAPAGIQKAEVFCRPLGSREFRAVPMVAQGKDQYRAIVPDWMTAGEGLEYYITATDHDGHSASRGFVGFPLVVRLVSTRPPTREERLKALDQTLDMLRKRRGTPGTPGGGYPGRGVGDPTQERYDRYR